MKRSTIFTLMMIVLGTSALNGCAAPTETPAVIPLPSPTVTSTPEPLSGITLYYGGSAQFEVISPGGTRVMFDVINPANLSSPVTGKDVLLTTHEHGDHYNSSFVESFPGQEITFREGEINLPDTRIISIPSSHTAAGSILPEGGSNYIFIVDMGGLRIAHFGDIGQDELTGEQLQILGEVDIAITQFDNRFSDMNITNKKGFNLMDQIKPKLIIPTGHVNQATMDFAVEKWKGYAHTDSNNVSINRADLPAEQSILVIGPLAIAYQKLFDLPSW